MISYSTSTSGCAHVECYFSINDYFGLFLSLFFFLSLVFTVGLLCKLKYAFNSATHYLYKFIGLPWCIRAIPAFCSLIDRITPSIPQKAFCRTKCVRVELNCDVIVLTKTGSICQCFAWFIFLSCEYLALF